MTASPKAVAALGAIATALLTPTLLLAWQASATAAEPAFVRIVNAYDAPTDITVHLGNRPDNQLTWASATPWMAAAPGAQPVSVHAAQSVVALLQVNLQADCSITMIILRTSAADSAPTAATLANCGTTRIPGGEARITAFGSTVDELGPVEAHLGTATVTSPPRQFPMVGQDLAAGPQTLTVGAPGSAEIYQRIQPDLQAGAAYTLLYLGGGETPAKLVLLLDGRQAPDPPPPNLPINTGIGDPSGHSTSGLGTLTILTALLLVVSMVRRRAPAQRRLPNPGKARRARRVAAVAGLLLCSSCGFTPTPSTGVTVPAQPRAGIVQPKPTRNLASPSLTEGGAEEVGAVPVTLAIPSLQRTDPLIPFSTAKISQLPKSLPLQQVSWLSGSSLIGEPGTTAVIAHTTGPGRTPAPFNDLGKLWPGQHLQITATDGSTFDYEVVSVDITPKGALPQSVFAPQPVSTVVLITCADGGSGPPGSYLDNLLVTALPNERT